MDSRSESPTVDLILRARSGAIIGTFSLHCDHLPRLGEVIDLTGLATAMPLRDKQYRVLDVIYRYQQQKIVPHLTCQPLAEEH